MAVYAARPPRDVRELRERVSGVPEPRTRSRLAIVAVMRREQEYAARPDHPSDLAQRAQPRLVSECAESGIREQHEIETRVGKARQVARVTQFEAHLRKSPRRVRDHRRGVVDTHIAAGERTEVERRATRADSDVEHVAPSHQIPILDQEQGKRRFQAVVGRKSLDGGLALVPRAIDAIRARHLISLIRGLLLPDRLTNWPCLTPTILQNAASILYLARLLLYNSRIPDCPKTIRLLSFRPDQCP